MAPKKGKAKAAGKPVVTQRPAVAPKTEAEKAEAIKKAQRKEVREHFRRFDLNGDGIISHEEMTMVLTSLNPQAWNDEAINKVISSCDKNGDGAIQYEEFCDWVFGGSENREVIEAVNEISHQGCKFIVLEVLDTNFAYIRSPTGAIIGAIPWSRESAGWNTDLVHAAGRSFTADSAFKGATLPNDVPVVVLMDAGKAGGNYIPSAVFSLLQHSGIDFTSGSLLKFAVAAPTSTTPRACLIGSACLSTRYFLWEFQRQCSKYKFGGKTAFLAREALYVGQETLYNIVLDQAFDKLAETESLNLGGKHVMDYCVSMCKQLKENGNALNAAGCNPNFRFVQSFGAYINYEPESEGWPTEWPPGYGAPTTSTLAGHNLQMMLEPDDTVLFALGESLKEGMRVIDSRAAEASLEKVFMVTRKGLQSRHDPVAVQLLESMCEDPGVTRWNEAAITEKFGPVPNKSAGQKYEEYLNSCREAMDGVCVLDFPVDFWINDFLVDLMAAESITICMVLSPAFSSERYGIDDQSGFYCFDFIDLNARLPFASIMGVIVMPEDNATNLDWAHAGAFLWHMRETTDGLIALPGAQAKTGGWGGKFLATWMSITSVSVKQRFHGHLSLGRPHDIFAPFYFEGESSSAAIDHAHQLVGEAPLISTFTLSCGCQAGYRLEAFLDRISKIGKRKVFGTIGDDSVFFQAAGETSDDHGDNSLEEGAVRYATVASGGKSLVEMLEKCCSCMEEKAELDKGRDEDADTWRVMSVGDGGLRSQIVTQTKKVRKAWA